MKGGRVKKILLWEYFCRGLRKFTANVSKILIGKIIFRSCHGKKRKLKIIKPRNSFIHILAILHNNAC